MPSFLINRIPSLHEGEETVEEALDRVVRGANKNFETVKQLLYGNLDFVNMRDGGITPSKIDIVIDDIPDGATYGKVLSTSITAGKIILSETEGNIDDIADGITHGKVLSTNITAGKIVLAESHDGGKVTYLDTSGIYTGTLTALQVNAVNINADSITAGTLSANRIGAGTIEATKLNVAQLSAISANLGTITAGTVTGALIRTAASGARIEFTSANLLRCYNAVGHLHGPYVDPVGTYSYESITRFYASGSPFFSVSNYADTAAWLLGTSGLTLTCNGWLYLGTTVANVSFGLANSVSGLNTDNDTHNHGGSTASAGAHGHLGGGVGVNDQVWVRRGGVGSGEWVNFFAQNNHQHTVANDTHNHNVKKS